MKKIRVTVPEDVWDIIKIDQEDFGINNNKFCNYILEKLKTKEDIVEFFKHLSIQTTNSYNDNNLHDVVNISKVQEKILLALSDLNSNVNATLVLEKFLFTILLDNNNLDFLLRG